MANFDLSIIIRAIDKASGTFKKISGNMQRTGQKMQAAGDKMQAIGGTMTRMITLPLLGLGAAAVKAAADFEALETSFATMLGSAEKGKALFQDIQKFSSVTPFQMKDLSEGTKMLLNYGFTAKEILPTLKQLGDVSLGDSERMKLLALALGQVRGAGRLMGQELRQMINVGFNPLQEIARTTGKSYAELQEEMSKGLITYDMVIAAFKSATSEGGKFNDALKNASQTMKGKFSTFLDKMNIMLAKFGEIIAPILLDFMEKIQGIIEWFDKLDPKQKEQLVFWLGLAAAIGPATVAVGKFTSALGMLMKSGKAGLIIIAIGAAIIGIIAIVRNWESVSRFFIDTWNNIRYALRMFWEKLKSIASRMPNIILGMVAAGLPLVGLPLLIAKNWQLLAGIVTTVKNAIVTAFWAAVNGVASAFGFLWDKIKQGFNWVSGVIKGFIDWFSTTFQGPIEIIQNLFSGLTEFVVNAISNLVKTAGGIIASNPVLKFLFGAAGVPELGGSVDVNIDVNTAPGLAAKMVTTSSGNVNTKTNMDMGQTRARTGGLK